jgi:RNA polymerase sigma-70 factor (ECF subfamily)
MNIEVTSNRERRRRFEGIAAEVFDPLQRYLRRRLDADEAQDALSDVMLTVWRRLDDAPADAVLPWCYGIARNTVANRRRGRRRHLRLVERLEAEPQPTTEPDPADAGPDAELSLALAGLSEDDREILRLWAWERLEPREIAPILELSVNAATLRLSRARSRLAEQLARQNPGTVGHEPVEGTQETA